MVAAPSSTPGPLASPDPSRLADLLTSPSLTLPEVAAELGVPFSDLFTFLTSPEGEAFAHSLTTLHTQRARLAASALIPKIITTLKSTLDHYDTHVKAGTATESHHDRARKSCTLLLRLTSRSVGFQPTPRPPTPPSPAHLPTSSPVHSSPRPSASSAYGPSSSRTGHSSAGAAPSPVDPTPPLPEYIYTPEPERDPADTRLFVPLEERIAYQASLKNAQASAQTSSPTSSSPRRSAPTPPLRDLPSHPGTRHSAPDTTSSPPTSPPRSDSS